MEYIYTKTICLRLPLFPSSRSKVPQIFYCFGNMDRYDDSQGLLVALRDVSVALN
jgi:hypothetical protein